MTPDESASPKRTPNWRPIFSSLTGRAIGLCLLALAMLVPVGWVSGIVSERAGSYRMVLHDIARAWGAEQTVSGPVVVIPFTERYTTSEEVTDDQGRTRTVQKTHRQLRHANFLPDLLRIDAQLAEQFRQRSIYSALVYEAGVSVDARFGSFDVKSLSDHIETIHWDKAWLAVGLTDTRAIDSVESIQFAGSDHQLSPGTRLPWLGKGFHAPLALSEDSALVNASSALVLKMAIKGSSQFAFAPFGQTTEVAINATWPHPSFMGNALPDSRQISEDGFSAQWDIPHLARNFPQQWVGPWDENEIRGFVAGVRMFEPVTLYSKLTRAVKYGLLFIGLTFITLFGFEVATRQPLHVIQYALIGSALSLFYLIVLSLSEHISFLTAYLVGAALIISMIAGYTLAVLRDKAKALIVFVLLGGLYAMLYSVLQLEDYALLMGTGLLLVVLVALMIATRNLHRSTDQPLPTASAAA